jgi:hypothetical protein
MESTSTTASADTKAPKDHMAECVDFVIRYDSVNMMLYCSFLANSSANDDIQLANLYEATHYDECREECLALLAEPGLAHVTRVQTLQMASTVTQPAQQHAHLKEAASLLEEMDAGLSEVRLLKADKDKMFARLKWWLKVNGKVGLPLEMLCHPQFGGQHGTACRCDAGMSIYAHVTNR